MANVINPEELLAAVEESTFGLGNDGFCIACGNQQDGCEPDACGYECEACGEPEVYGAMELLLMGYA